MAKEYEFYEHFDEYRQKSSLNSEYQNAYNKSVSSRGVAQPTKKSNLTNSQIKGSIIAIGMAVVLAVTSWVAVSAHNMVENFQEDQIVSEYYKEMGVDDILKEASWKYITDKGEYVYGYNHDTLANWVETKENQDLALFGLYKGISGNKSSNMDEIVTRISKEDGIGADSFSNYLAKRNFVEGGNPSQDLYESAMNKRALSDANAKSTETNHGIGK